MSSRDIAAIDASKSSICANLNTLEAVPAKLGSARRSLTLTPPTLTPLATTPLILDPNGPLTLRASCSCLECPALGVSRALD